jgi:hypothetical protein
MELKNFRFLGEEAEVLGRRLDNARNSLSKSKTKWAKNYWQQTITRLESQWQKLPYLKDADARTVAVSRWKVSYDFFEKDDGTGICNYIDNWFREYLFGVNQSNLNTSWNREVERRLAKAQ